jgi:hypothetical protein
MNTRLNSAAVAAAILLSVAPAAAREPLACLAPSLPSEAAKPLQGVDSLEFYADEGDPLKSYSVPFKRLQSAVDAAGKTTNAYSVADADATGATIVFAGTTPLSFTVVEIGKTFATLKRNDEETGFMADAVPGVVCWSVSVESLPL